MRRFLRCFNRGEVICALWIAVCFSLTSSAYLSWTYHLMAFSAPETVDVYSLVVGYGFQAAGLGLSLVFFRRTPAMNDWKAFCICVLIFCVATLPALLGDSLAGALSFGFLMNLMCGVLSGFYLCGTAMKLKASSRGKAFGFGYALSTVFIFLLSLCCDGGFLRTQSVFIVDLLLAAGAMGMAVPQFRLAPLPEASREEQAARPLPREGLRMAIAVVVLLSLVKNMGFNFPAADVSQGAILEFSRLFYAAGLIAAGIISDKNRKNGAVCTVAALVLPFVMLALSGEGLPVMICWGLDYLFYGFFSMFRVLLFMDAAERNGVWPLAVWGLLAGRAGDALGTALYLLCAFSRFLLIFVTLGFFIVTVLLFIRLCQRLYMPEAVREKSEREVFESFAIQHDLSAREREVLRLVLAEETVPQIAETLFVTESTVRYHVHNLLQKSGCKSRQELVKSYNLKLYPHISKE